MVDAYASDPDFGNVMPALAIGKTQDPYMLKDGFLLYNSRLCVTQALREKVMLESHAPRAIKMYFYWPSMKKYIQAYISQCLTCQKVKYDRGKQLGLLQPLPIPNAPWESISMDFIFGLPKSIHGNIGIWIIVDRFSKQAHFIPIKNTIKSHHMATLFIS